MSFNFKNNLYISVFLLLVGSAAQATTLYVNCGAKTGLTTINAAINAVQHSEAHGPVTINVSGACHENILVQDMDRLTLNALRGASITDASNGTREVIDIANAHGFTLTGFTIATACGAGCTYPDAISCYSGADCLLTQNTISGAGGSAGVGVYALSRVRIVGGSLHDNAIGLWATDSGEMMVVGVSIQNNGQGAVVRRGANLLIRSGEDNLTPSVIANNTGQGIDVSDGSTVTVAGPSSITDNGAEGVLLDLGSTLVLGTYYGPVSITGNSSSGVRLGDLSVARFAGTSGVTGNGQPDVTCSATAVTRRATTGIGGGTTDCAN
jgi:hypothetical protein